MLYINLSKYQNQDINLIESVKTYVEPTEVQTHLANSAKSLPYLPNITHKI